MEKIIIYTNETCGYCKQIKEEFTKKDIKFEEKLTSDFTDEYQEVVNLTGKSTVPTIKCNDEYFVAGRDFGTPQQLIAMLEHFTHSPFSDSRRTLERMKTLNFNMNTAFGKLDQLLRQIENKLNIEEDEHKSTS